MNVFCSHWVAHTRRQISLSYILIIAFLCMGQTLSHAQEAVVIDSELRKYGRIAYTCTNRTFANYFIEVDFEELGSYAGSVHFPYRRIVTPGTNRLFTLEPRGVERNVEGMQFSFVKGCPDPKIQSGFVYTPPIAPGKDFSLVEPYALDSAIVQILDEKRYFYLFRMDARDTVFAARKGIITAIETYNRSDDFSDGFYLESTVEIQHDDCTFAYYSLLRNDVLFTNVGDVVFPGDPLGMISRRPHTEGTLLLFSVNYLREDKKAANADDRFIWVQMPVPFCVQGQASVFLKSDQTYTSEHPRRIVQKEMSKKERKAWRQKQP